MEGQTPNGSLRYKIFNYKDLNELFVTSNFDEWSREVGRLTEGLMVTQWHQFSSPLTCFGSFGKQLMKLKLSRNHGFYHRFLVFELNDVVSTHVGHARSRAVSIEKFHWGFLFQIASNVDTLKCNIQGSLRSYVREHASSLTMGFEGQLTNNLILVKTMLENLDTFEAYYSLLYQNCQHTVAECMKVLVDHSLALKLHIPASTEKIALTEDETTIKVVESLFPRWKEMSCSFSLTFKILRHLG